jgi:hypothetical protein
MKRRIATGVGLSALIGGTARWRGMLTMGGVIGSMLIGTIFAAIGPWQISVEPTGN